MIDSYLVSAGLPAAIAAAVPTDTASRKPSRRSLVSRSSKRSADDFAVAKSGLDSIRTLFYAPSGRMPNTRADATRRQRSLTGGSGDRHLGQLDLWTEREISRHLRDQSSIFSGMIETWAAETIQTGFRLKPATGDADLDILLKEVLFGWDGDGGWCADCDARGLLHFWDLLTLAEETELTDGDHGFWLDPDGNGGRGSVALIEGDRILTPYGAKVAEGYTLVNGIVMDRVGRPVSAFVANEAPQYSFCSVENGDFYPMFDPRRPAAGGLLFSVSLKRATATRRQPWLSSAVRAHDEIDDVFVAVRIALRNAACRATYTKIDNFESYMQWLQLVDPTVAAPAPVEGLTHSPAPGDHVVLNPGEESGVLETNAPGDNFDPFMQLQLTTLGLPLGMCLEESVRIFQKSFSASRMAVDSTRRRYERRQRQIKRRKVSPVLAFAIARLQALGILPDDPRCNRILCGFPGWPYMEPLKDAKASETLVKNKLRSRRTCATEIGDDYDAEIPLMQEEDVLFPQPAAPAAPRAAQDPDERDDEEDDA